MTGEVPPYLDGAPGARAVRSEVRQTYKSTELSAVGGGLPPDLTDLSIRSGVSELQSATGALKAGGAIAEVVLAASESRMAGTQRNGAVMALSRFIGGMLAALPVDTELAPQQTAGSPGGARNAAMSLERRYLLDSGVAIAGDHDAVRELPDGPKPSSVGDRGAPEATLPEIPETARLSASSAAAAEMRLLVAWRAGEPPLAVDLRLEEEASEACHSGREGDEGRRVVRFAIDTGATGRVSVVLGSAAGRLSVALSAEIPGMAQTIRESATELGRELAGAGLQLDRIDVIGAEVVAAAPVVV